MTSIIDLSGTDEPIAPTVQTPAVGGPARGSDRGSRPDDGPRPLHQRSADDVLSVAGAAVGSFCLMWLIYYDLLPLSGLVGFVVCWYFGFLGLYAGVTALAHPKPVVVDRVIAAVVTLAALLVGFALTTVVVYTIASGRHAIVHLNFFMDSGGGPLTPLTKGGISNAVVGSAIQVGIAVLFSLPLGLGTALFMTEVRGWLPRLVRTVVEAMTAVPDLLAGLFVYVTLIVGFHMQKDGLAAAIALAVTMTPIIARSAEVALRVVPGGLREASLALGAPQWKTVLSVVLPTARPGLATALILSVARGIGESAPLLIVSGGSSFFNTNPFNNPMNSLPLYIYNGARSGQPNDIARAFGAATVLLVIVFVLFIVTRLLARQRVGRR